MRRQMSRSCVPASAKTPASSKLAELASDRDFLMSNQLASDEVLHMLIRASLSSEPLLFIGVRGNLKPLANGELEGDVARVAKEGVVLPSADGEEPLPLPIGRVGGAGIGGLLPPLPPPPEENFMLLPPPEDNMMLPPTVTVVEDLALVSEPTGMGLLVPLLLVG
mmetsp:Transcript_51301/g.137199  ORF Transcript_51301/g.137199 Transcript_51301/m.137199 type:complete len:165 (+) Transcript_51301:2065-2559(+)